MWRPEANVLHLLQNLSSLQNPSFDGIVFKFAFMVQLRAISEKKLPGRTKMQLYNENGEPPEWWDVKNYEVFEPTEMSQIPQKEWLIPKKFNQAGLN